ncbi:hypothetical protein Tco_1395980 [Tanacetum coccineum]
MIQNGKWCWPNDWYERFPMVTSMVDPNVNNISVDKMVWKDKDGEWETFSVSIANKSLSPERPDVPWWKLFSNQVWDKVQSMANVKSTTSDWTKIVQDMTDMGNGNSIRSVIRRLIFAASVYCIWQERNARIFKDERKRCEDVYNMMIETVKCKLLNLTVKESLNLIGGQLKSWSDKGVFGIRSWRREVCVSWCWNKDWFIFLMSNLWDAMEDRLDMYKGLCFYPSDAFNSMSLSLIYDGYMQIGDGGVLEGNVARMKEHLVHCEWAIYFIMMHAYLSLLPLWLQVKWYLSRLSLEM